MAARRAAVPVQQPVPTAPPPTMEQYLTMQTFPEPEDDDDDDLDPTLNLLAELGDDASQGKVSIYHNVRAAGGSTNEELLYETTPAEWGGWSEVQQLYGKGDYRIRVFAPKEVTRNGRVTKRMSLVLNRRQAIAEPFKPREPEGPKVAAPPVDIVAVLQQMNEANRMANAELMRNMFDAVQRMQPPPPPQRSEEDMLRMLAVMKTIVAQPAPMPTHAAPSAQKTFIDQLREMKEVETLLRGFSGVASAEEGEPGLLTLGSKLLDVIGAGGIMAQGPQQAAPQPPARPQARPPAPQAPGAPQRPPQRATGPVAAPAPDPGEPQVDPRIVLLNEHLTVLIAAAEAGSDPYAYAVLTLDRFGSDLANQFLMQPDWWQGLSMFNPQVIPHQEWFMEMHQEVVDLLQDNEEEGTEADESTPGPAPHVRSPADSTGSDPSGTA